MFKRKTRGYRLTMLLGLALAVITWDSYSNIASLASAKTSYVSPWESLSAVNDNNNPSNANDKSSGAYGNWNNPNSIQWVQYDWQQNYSLSSTEIYWFDDNGGVQVPTTAYIEYLDGNSWINAGDVPLVEDAFNALALDNVVTSRLRMSMRNTRQSTFIDDDGQAYLAYGGFGRMVTVALADDMISLEGSMIEQTPSVFFQAPYITKRAGVYCMIYARIPPQSTMPPPTAQWGPGNIVEGYLMLCQACRVKMRPLVTQPSPNSRANGTWCIT